MSERQAAVNLIATWQAATDAQYVRYRASADPRNRALWHGDAYLLMIAIREVLRACELLNRLTGDHLIRAALDQVSLRHDIAAVRDMISHLDSYLLSEGGSGEESKAYQRLALNILRDTSDTMHTIELNGSTLSTGQSKQVRSI